MIRRHERDPNCYSYLGIDPGASGGVALVQGDYVAAWKIRGRTGSDLASLFGQIKTEHLVKMAVLEKVAAFPKQGVSSTFKFGHSAGLLEGMLWAFEFRFELVAPGGWQRPMGLICPKGTTLTVKKNKHKARAQQLFPELEITHAIADALLIAEHARRTYQ